MLSRIVAVMEIIKNNIEDLDWDAVGEIGEAIQKSMQ